MAILLVNPLLDEVFKMTSDLTWKKFQSTLQSTSLVGWEDLVPRPHLQIRDGGAGQPRVGDDLHGSKEVVEGDVRRKCKKTGRREMKT